MTSKPSRTRALRVSSGVVAAAATVFTVGAMLAPAANAARVNPDAAAGPVASLTLSPSSATTSTGNCQEFTVSAKTASGAADSGATVTVTATQSGGSTVTLTDCSPATTAEGQSDGATVTSANTAGTATTPTTDTDTVVLGTDGTAVVGFNPNTPGSVSITANANGHSANATLTVDAAQTGNDNARSLSVTPTSQKEPVGTDGTYTVTARDSNGNPLNGAAVQFIITSGPDATTTAESCGTTAEDTSVTPNTNGTTSCTVPTGTNTTAGTDNITFFVDQANGTTGSPDAGEPTATATETFVAYGTPTDTLTVSAPAGTVGQTETITVNDANADGSPRADSVQIQVTGADNVTGTVTISNTGATPGQGTFSYVPGNAGTDQISATSQNSRGTFGGDNGGFSTAHTTATISGSGGGNTGGSFHSTQTLTSSHKGNLHIHISTNPAQGGQQVRFYNETSSGRHHLGSNGTTGKGGALSVTFKKKSGSTYHVFEIIEGQHSGTKKITVK